MTNFLKELSKNKEYFCMAVIILLLVYLFCNTCNKENLIMKGNSGTNMSQVLGLNSNNEIVLSENLSTVGSAVPIGTILMWSPKYASPDITSPMTNIPTGWLVCDGKTTTIGGKPYSTPDLRGKFIKGSSLTYTKYLVDQPYTKQPVKLKLSDMPPHEHIGLPGTTCTGASCSLNNVKPGNGYRNRDGLTLGIDQWPTTGTTKKVLVAQTPIDIPDPDYYTLVFIIKVY